MQTFKQFTESKSKSNKLIHDQIFNSHGSHSQIYASDAKIIKQFKSPHTTNVYYKRKRFKLRESLEHAKDLQEFIGEHKGREANEGLDNDIAKLERTHRHNKLAKDVHNKLTSGSKGLNNALVRHYYEGDYVHPNYQDQAQELDKHGFVPAKKDFNSYTGVGYDLTNVKPSGVSPAGNKTYHQPAYHSSSISKLTAHAFADDSRSRVDGLHILQWHHKKGEPVGIVGKNSDFPKEREVLVPRTESDPKKYHIEHLSTDHYKDAEGTHIQVHHVRRIPESEIIKG